MKYLMVALCLLLCASFAFAQTVVMLHKTNGTQQAFYSNNALVDAYNAAAVSGDTIYLPGGGFAPPGTFDKGVIIYGVGHYPDSTSATNKTVISSGFAIGGNGDRFHLEGVQVNGGINTTYDQAVDYIVLKRNYIIGTIDIQGTNTANPSRFMLIEGNVITGQIVATNGQQVLVTNNITMSNLVNLMAVLCGIMFSCMNLEVHRAPLMYWWLVITMYWRIMYSTMRLHTAFPVFKPSVKTFFFYQPQTLAHR
jgi:hypothetical protein